MGLFFPFPPFPVKDRRRSKDRSYAKFVYRHFTTFPVTSDFRFEFVMKRLTRCCCTDVSHGATILAVLTALSYAFASITSITLWARRGNLYGQMDASTRSLFDFCLSCLIGLCW